MLGGRRLLRSIALTAFDRETAGAPFAPRAGVEPDRSDSRDLGGQHYHRGRYARAAVCDGVATGRTPAASRRARSSRAAAGSGRPGASSANGTLTAPGMCPATGSTGSASPR